MLLPTILPVAANRPTQQVALWIILWTTCNSDVSSRGLHYCRNHGPGETVLYHYFKLKTCITT